MNFLKKLLSIALCFITLFFVLYFNTSANNKQNFEYTLFNGTIKITKCNLNDEEIIIPDTIDGYDVTNIDFLAFRRCSDVEKIVIGKNITSIGDGAFSNCTSLKMIVVSDENNSYLVKDNVLFNKDLTEIICYPTQKSGSKYLMPHSVETIKMNSFSKCEYLEEIELSDNLKTISTSAFVGCEKLNSIIMSSKVEKIEQDAFNDCSKELCIYYNGSQKQWDNINIEGSNKDQLRKMVVYKEPDKNFDVMLTVNDFELSYSSIVPFDFKVSNDSVVKIVDTIEESSSGIFIITAKIRLLKSGKTTISAVAKNGFVLCNFNYNVANCSHSSFHFLKTEKSSTCTEEGIEIYACDSCDYTESRNVKATGHSFGEWKVNTKPTKDKEGLEIRICNNCNYKEERTIPKLTVTPDDTSTDFILGDVDGNKKVNATDARKILRYVAGLEQLNDNQLKAANVDGNKKVTATDARKVLRHVAGLEEI